MEGLVLTLTEVSVGSGAGAFFSSMVNVLATVPEYLSMPRTVTVALPTAVLPA